MKTTTFQHEEALQDTPSHQREHGIPDAGPWRAVFCDGPQPTTNQHGDEIPCWQVYVGDEEAEPVAQLYTLHSWTAATALAHRMARDRRLELIMDATNA